MLSLFSARQEARFLPLGQAPRGGENQGSEGRMLYLEDPPLVGSFFDFFVLAVAGWERAASVGGSVRVEDADIKKCSFVPSPPEATCNDVQASTILDVRGGS